MQCVPSAAVTCLPPRLRPTHTRLHPSTLNPRQVISLVTGQVSKNITVVGSLSSASIITPDVQAGCPAVVHVIDSVLLPAIPPLVDDTSAGGMWAALMKIWGQ